MPDLDDEELSATRKLNGVDVVTGENAGKWKIKYKSGKDHEPEKDGNHDRANVQTFHRVHRMIPSLLII